jgi:2-haloacid dehalogenase
VPGTGDVVRELHAAGVRLLALTNWSAELYPHAPRRFDVLALFEDVVVSGEVGLAKPDPRIYTLVAERAGLPPGRLVFVDDRRVNVDAARAAGMDGIVFTDAATLRRELRARGLPV